jgi:hypothetical protein
LLGNAFGLREGQGIPDRALAGLSGTHLPVSWGIVGDRFDAERIESEGRKRLGDQDFEKAFAAGAAAGVEDLTPSS